MNTAQFLAADPKASAWVAASAGTGKTKVLTDRLLNLLLEGFAPERLLCLTFTKAAAAEMSNRLMKKLASWATLSNLNLAEELVTLTGKSLASTDLLHRARQLFTLVLDTPGGMKIQTIHGFCQSILARFPLEAEIPPHFHVLDDYQSEEILKIAQNSVFERPSPLVDKALSILNPYMTDLRFLSLLEDINQQRARLDSLLNQYDTIWDYAHFLLNFLEINELVNNPHEILEPSLAETLKKQFAPNEDNFETYIRIYLTQKNEVRKKLSPVQMRRAEEVLRFVKSLSALEITQRTLATLILFQEISREYTERKIDLGALDYDDLIQKTNTLLKQSGMANWVLFKLDGGNDHLLIDEAQDTNGPQWEIILSLTSEFFTPDKPYRTIFAVGDAKQSIYSFQGAKPEEFLKLKDYFSTHSQRIGQTWRDVQMDLSYRSTAAILTIVDEIFAHEQNKRGVSFENTDITHKVSREPLETHLPGLVEVWPLIQTTPLEEDLESRGEWPLPLRRMKKQIPEFQLAEYIADKIENWIGSGGVLPSTHQPVQPRDILILVRKRNNLSEHIISALKKKNIPVAGADRLILTDHIAVMDLLSLGEFTLLPEDDLTLACVLRSPLIGLSEEDLFTLAHGRAGSLWTSLSEKAQRSPSFEVAHNWLEACLNQADISPVYEFYSWILTLMQGRKKILGRLGHEAEDVLEEFLTQCLNYDQTHTSSLQGFIHFMKSQRQEIKRDTSDTTHNEVRLMTIHGSKGLQAPIVILPDAAQSTKGKVDSLLWGDELVMICPPQTHDTDQTLTLKNKARIDEDCEKNRLLYVALTRAQDRLYVAGYTTGKELSKDTWYHKIKYAVEQKSGTQRYFHGTDQGEDTFLKSLENLPIQPVSVPDWALTHPQRFNPTKPYSFEKTNAPSLAIERGILIHRLFEYLPTIPVNLRYNAACKVIEKEGLNIQEWETDIHETMHIMEKPELKALFGPQSCAEVPISGYIDGNPFQGRIDRLLITDETINIVDYKTDRKPASAHEDIPESYLKQLEKYSKALQSIYPKHKIRKFLLWTEGPSIQVVDA